MTAKVINLIQPTAEKLKLSEEHIHQEGCSGCSKSKEKVRGKVRRLHRDYAKEFTSYYLLKLNDRGFKLTFETTHIIMYFEKLLDSICKNTEMGELLISNQCPNKILDQYGDKVAGDYFLIRYLKSGNSIRQCLDYSRGCYMTWYGEDKLNNIIGSILYDNLEEFLSLSSNFTKDLDFEISF